MGRNLMCVLAVLTLSSLTWAEEPGATVQPTGAKTLPMPSEGSEFDHKLVPPPVGPAASASLNAPRLDDLRSQVRQLEDRVEDLEEANRHRTGTVGLALLAGDGLYAGGIEADLRFLYATYWFGRGFEAGLRVGDDMGRIRAGPLDLRFRVDILDLGIVYYLGGGPFTVTDIPRTWDMSLKAGLSIHFWKGLTLRGRVSWYLPNPAVAMDKIGSSVKEASDTLNPGAIGGGIDSVGDFYKRAFMAPKADIAILWAF